jgi:hypothetical protein
VLYVKIVRICYSHLIFFQLLDLHVRKFFFDIDSLDNDASQGTCWVLWLVTDAVFGWDAILLHCLGAQSDVAPQ